MVKYSTNMHICCNFKNKMKKKTKETAIYVLIECIKQKKKNKKGHDWNKYKFTICSVAFTITKTIFVLNEKKIGIYVGTALVLSFLKCLNILKKKTLYSSSM